MACNGGGALVHLYEATMYICRYHPRENKNKNKQKNVIKWRFIRSGRN